MGSEMPQQFDDVLTELLIDKINLWFKTFKLNPSYVETKISREVLVDHIQRHVIQPNKITNAAKELLKISSVIEAAGVTSENEREFISHANRYFEMYLPNAGCEISETPRYSGSDKREACIIATKKWQVGDEIKYCTGVLVPITSEEERALEGGRDFSIMWSTRKDCMCLLLGPARFVNHDCNPNTHFIATGQNTISFKLLRDVAVGEELTAHYGENYFGQGNEECLCVTCEQKQTGGFRKVRDETEEEAYEGLRPFVYNDGRLVRRSMRRNKAIQFNNTTKSKSKLVPVRINKNMDDDLVAENSSMDINSDISPADDHTNSTQIQMDLDERTASVRTQPTINANVSGRVTSTNRTENKNYPPVNSASISVRQRTFLEPMSFKALFSTRRVPPNASFTAINSFSGNSSKLSRDIETGDHELRTNVSQESCDNNYQSLRTNTDRDDNPSSRSTLQRPNRDSGMLMHTTITNSRANQEITSTGLSIQSNVTSEQSSRTVSTVVPHVSRGINSISVLKFPQSTTDDRSISVNHVNSRNTSKYDSHSIINRRESEPVYTTRTIERVPNVSPVSVNQDGRRSTASNQTSNTRFNRQHLDSLTQKGLPANGEITGLVTSRPWTGVELTANPNIQITWGIETQIIVPGNNSWQRQFPSLSKGRGNRLRATNNNTSRMSIAYLCSNDLPGQNDSNQKLSSASFFNDKLNIKRVCRVCREKFAPLPTDMNAHKCPRCTRHFSLYNLEWPLRKQPRQPKERGKAKETKNRNEIINRRDKKATGMAPVITTTNNNKGKTRQITVPVTYIGDKKEHNERMQAIIFAESNEEWLPVPDIDREKYVVGEEQPTAGKAFSISMKRKRNEKFTTGEAWYKPFLRWSASTGYVHLNSIWRYVEFHTSPDNNKLRMVKKKVCKTSPSGFEDSGSFPAASLQGGYATYQGDWVPYEDALKIVEELGVPELLQKFILPPDGNIAATSSFLGTASSSKRKYEEVDAEDSDTEPSHKKRT
ncbi:hypothetical protein RclHR1_00380016 [Rhizophagus clarus]|uniref:Uncharacterized protein n=1 Tax=Rhizophagus clarus TaxID=94130 RepID=A0A2Z6RCL5_9GLOM|nr:hypothetical protein RclHR1_00380016 [Rhizophagus clarus]